MSTRSTDPDGATDPQGGTAPAPSGGTGDADRIVDPVAVFVGALVGLAVLVGASVVDALLDRNLADYDASGWRYALFVVILVGYVSAGFLAGRRAPAGALTNGALAGTLAFVLWVPVRILIWVARDEDKALFTGAAPVFKVGQVIGHLVIASALGMLGGVLGSRLVVKRAR